jgi:hypothetical protein
MIAQAEQAESESESESRTFVEDGDGRVID